MSVKQQGKAAMGNEYLIQEKPLKALIVFALPMIKIGRAHV